MTTSPGCVALFAFVIREFRELFSPQKTTMKKILATIQGQDIHHEITCDYETVEFIGDMDIDCDGSGGNPYHDPYFQPDTSLHFPAKPNKLGKALHAETVPYVVVPPIVVKGTVGIVLGSLCEVSYQGHTVHAVVGDTGPTRKVGEGSPRLADLLGIPSNPNTGGVDAFDVTYKVHVGVPAVIDGITYELQRAGA